MGGRRRTAAAVIVASLVASTLAAAGDLALLEEFRAACDAFRSQKLEGTAQMILGRDGWILQEEDMATLTAGRFWGADAARANPGVRPDRADPVPAIVHFNDELAARGIQLYFMPVPIRSAIYPESVLGTERITRAGRVPNLHPELGEFLALLSSEGVRTIDLSETFIAARSGPHGPLFCRTDAHWSPAGIVLAAERLAHQLSRQSWYADVATSPFTTEWIPYEHDGKMISRLEKAGHGTQPPDQIQLRTVRHESGTQLELDDNSSPVMVMGDSNTFWWKLHDASMAHQLSAELGFEVRLLSTAGGGATDVRLQLVRTLKRQPELLQHTRAVIWCLSARSTTNTSTGWLKTPLPPPREADTNSR